MLGLLQFSGFVIGRIAAVKRASRPQAQLVPPFPFRLATETAAVLIKRMRAQLTEKVGAFHFFDCHACRLYPLVTVRNTVFGYMRTAVPEKASPGVSFPRGRCASTGTSERAILASQSSLAPSAVTPEINVLALLFGITPDLVLRFQPVSPLVAFEGFSEFGIIREMPNKRRALGGVFGTPPKAS